MALVNFHRLDAAAYTSLGTKQPDTIYFVTDARRIYMGEKEYGLQVVSGTRPGTGSLNTLYIDSAAHTISYWNGTSYDALEIPFGTTISGTGDDAHLATTKAVVDYVASKLTDLDVGALAGRVDTLETEMDTAQGDITTIKGQITTINGEGEGSIKKALSDAKAYTDSVASGKADVEHTHEIADVNGLQDALDGKANATHTHTTAQVDGLDAALAGKANKATTLAGYGIADAYTKGETDSAIATAVAAAPHLKRTIVEDLPDVEGADENTIYMVGTGAGSEDSAYEEYMLINGAFEKIGSSKVDLTNYAEKTYVDAAKQEAVSTAATDATQKANTAEQNAKTYADGLIAGLDVEDSAQSGKYVSAVAEVDGKIQVTRADLPAAATLVEGTENGTVKFNGTDVPVHGLGSAAYTEASAYETAGAAATAVAALDKADSAQEGQYVSAVSQENGIITVTRATLPTAPEITTGSANGTIAVGGTDVAVKGLGSAAYTETTAYATAAQGTKADQVFAALTWQEG